MLAFSRAVMDLARPTSSGTTIAGKTTMPRRGSKGSWRGALTFWFSCWIMIFVHPHYSNIRERGDESCKTNIAKNVKPGSIIQAYNQAITPIRSVS